MLTRVTFSQKVKKSVSRITPYKTVLFILLSLYALSMIAMFAWAIMSSLKSADEFQDTPLSFPTVFHFENYVLAFRDFFVEIKQRKVYIEEMLIYSLLYAGVGSILQTFVSSITAYASSRYKFFFSKVVYAIVIITMILPIIGSMPAELQILRWLHLYDTFIGMFILKANFLGLYFLVFHASFSGVPASFSEAAKIDGAGNFRIMVKIMYPMVKNIFLTVALINFIAFWNDYMTPLVYIPSRPTMAYGLYIVTTTTTETLDSIPVRLAACMLMFIPIMIVFVVFQKRLMGNISMGGIKE